MIDDKGRLFGKVSIIDLITILILILALVFLANKLNILSSAETLKLEDLEIVFFQEEVNDFSAENVNIGDLAKESLKNASFGKVKDIEIGPSISWDKDPDGKQVQSSRDGYVSFRVTMDAKGVLTDNGIVLNGSKFFVGQTITLKVGNSIFYGDIADVKKI